MLVSIGGYVAERVRGCETEFGRPGADGGVLYYRVIYYGHVAQAAYGFVLIIFSLAFAAILPLCKDARAGGRTVDAADTNGTNVNSKQSNLKKTEIRTDDFGGYTDTPSQTGCSQSEPSICPTHNLTSPPLQCFL
jgi:hypothetical protein